MFRFANPNSLTASDTREHTHTQPHHTRTRTINVVENQRSADRCRRAMCTRHDHCSGTLPEHNDLTHVRQAASSSVPHNSTSTCDHIHQPHTRVLDALARPPAMHVDVCARLVGERELQSGSACTSMSSAHHTHTHAPLPAPAPGAPAATAAAADATAAAAAAPHVHYIT
jgi:hypothetical protein